MYGRAKYGTDIYGGIFYSQSVTFSLSETINITENVRFNENISVNAQTNLSVTDSLIYNEAFSCYLDTVISVSDNYKAFNPDPDDINSIRYIPIDFMDRKATIMYDLRSVIIEERYNHAVSVA